MKKELSSDLDFPTEEFISKQSRCLTALILMVFFFLALCFAAGRSYGRVKTAVVFDGLPPTTFSEISRESGIRDFLPSYGAPIWGDFDKDGHQDVIVINHGRRPSVLRNNNDRTFTNVMERADIFPKGDRHGAALGDYDNDGDPDLFITVGGGRGEALGTKKDQLYRNDGSGVFTDVTELAGVANTLGRGRSVQWLDFDHDGYLDLFIKNHSTPNVLYRSSGDGTFTDIAPAAGIAGASGTVSSLIDYDGDGDLDLFTVSAAHQDELWKNLGDGALVEVTSAAGLASKKHGMSIAWGDYNNDGFLDLYVGRGSGDANDALAWDAESISFADKENSNEDGLDFATTGTEVEFALYSAKCADLSRIFIGGQKHSPTEFPFRLSPADADGRPVYNPERDFGFFVWHDQQGWHLRWSGGGRIHHFVGVLKSNGLFTDVSPLYTVRNDLSFRSDLYRNNGDGTFTDVSSASGVADRDDNGGAAWGDFDNDGFLDLYVVNSESFPRRRPNKLYRNRGDGTFENVADLAGVKANVQGRGDGAAWGDFDDDGFLDLYITNGQGRASLPKTYGATCLTFGPHLLFHNNANGNSWLKVRLVGTGSNRDGLGAKVILYTGSNLQYREMGIGGGGHYFSQGTGPLHFGLGTVQVIDALEVIWPDGHTQELRLVPAKQTITITEDD